MASSKIHEKFMKIAISLAKKSNPHPNPRVGALLVHQNQIIGKGFHLGPGSSHAEIEAINDAIKNGFESKISSSILYVTLEPCSHSFKRTSPCTKEIISRKIPCVVYGFTDPNSFVSGSKTLSSCGIKVFSNVLKKQCGSLISSYLKNQKIKPKVIVKIACSMDGKTATKTNDSKWITNDISRSFVHKLRSKCDAIVVGSKTVNLDDPLLTNRSGIGKTPDRFVLDRSLKTNPNSKIFSDPSAPTYLVTNSENDVLAKKKYPKTITLPNDFSLKFFITTLSNMGYKKILFEGGSTLLGSLFDENLVDEFYLFIAPIVIGGSEAKSCIGGKGISKISDSKKFSLIKIKKFKEDILLHYKRKI